MAACICVWRLNNVWWARRKSGSCKPRRQLINPVSPFCNLSVRKTVVCGSSAGSRGSTWFAPRSATLRWFWFCSETQVGLENGGTSLFDSLLIKDYLQRLRWVRIIESPALQLWTGVFVSICQRNRTNFIYIYINDKELAHAITEAKKFCNLPSASWSPRRVHGTVAVWVWGLGTRDLMA